MSLRNPGCCRQGRPAAVRSGARATQSSLSRNEGVPGSSPGVGSLKTPLSGVFVCRGADAPTLRSHLGRTVFVAGPCSADQVFRGDGFGVLEFVEDVAVG